MKITRQLPVEIDGEMLLANDQLTGVGKSF